MKKQTCLQSSIVFLILVFAVSILSEARTKGVKTSFKRYSIYTYKNEDVLCEPYNVKKDDWLYKIFRKKGEISEKDFPHFIIIFKEINPHINNIDAIEPGNNILIPLKKIRKQDYDLSSPGSIDVPVIEFSTTPDDLNLAPFIKEHTIKRGETISDLMDKEFLEKGGLISEEGLKAFQLANPNIKNINLVYEGTRVLVPDPSIKTQPWFRSLFGKRSPPRSEEIQPENEKKAKIQAHELAQLKKYAALIGGTLLNHGQMIFPGEGGAGNAIDLSSTPIIETQDGSKILIVSGNIISADLLDHIQTHWRNIKTQALTDALANSGRKKTVQSKRNKILGFQKLIEDLLTQVNHYQYLPRVKIPFTLNNIRLEARFGRVVRPETTDLLINFGNVYGAALEVLQKKEFEIISITPKQTSYDVVAMLLTRLGYSIWKDPSFFTGKTVEPLKGIYAVKNSKKIFAPFAPLDFNAKNYLRKEAIAIISLSKHDLTK